MEDVIITMDRIPVRMQRVSTAVDEDEKRKEEHEKQYEEVEKVREKIKLKMSFFRGTSCKNVIWIISVNITVTFPSRS